MISKHATVLGTDETGDGIGQGILGSQGKSQADHAEGLAGHLDAAEQLLVPTAVLEGGVGGGDVPRHADE